ncbi:orc1/cdc6 family replication initiation protein [Candidatus Woesearchaeota archaeon]|nr:orc1/cdc6 family replication initiation protein [Candidatus Woesearchaeota archaeon]
MAKIESLFEQFLDSVSLFKNKRVLQSNYTPQVLVHREEEISQIAKTLAPSLRGDKPSNLFIYGKTGTGKTVSVKCVLNSMRQIASQRNCSVKTVYVNCKLKKIADTEYRLVAEITRELLKAAGKDKEAKEIPSTGLPTEEIYKMFHAVVDEQSQVVILVLDEIDQLVQKTGDEILYNLTRLNSELEKAQVTLVGISNDVVFTETLDPRVKSSLSEEEMIFPPYNAIQLQRILSERAKEAFNGNVISDGVLEKCAAYAAREHGDARRALELLRVAGEVAERENASSLSLSHLDIAEEKIERDRMVDIVAAQPRQFQVALFVIFKMYMRREEVLFTGEVYEQYRTLCSQIHLRPLTQRRISDIIQEMDMMGIIAAKIISKGRYGRTREIHVSLPQSLIENIFKVLIDKASLEVEL